jgi:hypothetical protein
MLENGMENVRNWKELLSQVKFELFWKLQLGLFAFLQKKY